MSIKYKRVILKISGEALAGEEKHGIDPDVIGELCDKIKERIKKIKQYIIIHYLNMLKLK